MPRALFADTVIAESDDTVLVEGNHYFPPDALDDRYIERSPHTSVCPWKGTASYYDVLVDGERAPRAAWYYPETLPAADRIRGRVAFWRGVRVEP